MENLFGLLKTEIFYEREYKYKTIDDLINAIDDHIYCYNNKKDQEQIKRPDSCRIQESGPDEYLELILYEKRGAV